MNLSAYAAWLASFDREPRHEHVVIVEALMLDDEDNEDGVTSETCRCNPDDCTHEDSP